MSTEHTEISRTSVGDFLRLVGSELERASAFLSKAGASAPAPVGPPLPPPAPAAVRSEALAIARPASLPSAPIQAASPHGGAPGNTGAVQLLRASPGPPAAPHSSASSPPSPGLEAPEEGEAPEAPAVSSRSASFVRFGSISQREGLGRVSPATAAAAGPAPLPLLPAPAYPMPPLDSMHLSQTTASSAPSASSSSSSSAGGERVGAAAEEELARMLQLLAPAGASAAVGADVAQKETLEAELVSLQHSQGGSDKPTAVVPEELLQPSAAAGGQRQSPAAARTAVAAPPAPAMPASASAKLRALREEHQQAMPTSSAGLAAPAAEAQGQRKKSHQKVLRWLSQSQGEGASPCPQSPAGLPSSQPATSQRLRHLSPTPPAGGWPKAARPPPAEAAGGRQEAAQGQTAALPTCYVQPAAVEQRCHQQPAAAGPHYCAADRVDYCGQVPAVGCSPGAPWRHRSSLVRLVETGADVGGRQQQQQQQQGRSPLKLLRAAPCSGLKHLPRPRPYSAGRYHEQDGPAAAPEALLPQRPLQLQPQPDQPQALLQQLEPAGWAGERAPGGGISIGHIHTAYFGSGGPSVHGAPPLAALNTAAGDSSKPLASSRHTPSLDIWGAYLASRQAAAAAAAIEEGGLGLQNVDPGGDAVGQLRAISSRIKRMQGEITTFLSSSHAVLDEAPPLALGPPPSGPAAARQAGKTGLDLPTEVGLQSQPGAQQLPAMQPFDDDFIMSLKLGTDYKALQRSAAAAAAAAATGAAAGASAARAGDLGRAPSAASTGGGGRGEAIDRLKGLRASRAGRRVSHDTSIPVMRLGGSGRR